MVLYDQIGISYDSTRCADPCITQQLLEHLRFEPGAKYIDIACGSGNYTNAIAEKGAVMYGIDESSMMIDSAKIKNGAINWVKCSVEDLPFKDCSFNGAICTLAIHHFSSLRLAFHEVYRVLDHGRFVIFTSTKEQMQNYWLNEYFPNMMKDSIKQMPSLSSIKQSLSDEGFISVSTEVFNVSKELQDLFLYSGKYRPEMYLDSNVRAGISSFVNFSCENEVESGCNRIAIDIESRKINSIIQSYEKASGDYLFIIAQKN